MQNCWTMIMNHVKDTFSKKVALEQEIVKLHRIIKLKDIPAQLSWSKYKRNISEGRNEKTLAGISPNKVHVRGTKSHEKIKSFV